MHHVCDVVRYYVQRGVYVYTRLVGTEMHVRSAQDVWLCHSPQVKILEGDSSSSASALLVWIAGHRVRLHRRACGHDISRVEWLGEHRKRQPVDRIVRVLHLLASNIFLEE